MYKRLLLIWFLMAACVLVRAQDSLHVPSPVGHTDTIYTEANLIQYADTFRLINEQQTVEEDDTEQLMLRLMHEQSVRLKQKQDSLQAVQDSLLRLDPVWMAMQDSLRVLQEQAEALAEQMRLDSLAREQAYRDSLVASFVKTEAAIAMDTQRVELSPTRAMMQDAEEERQERLRALRSYSPWYKEAYGLLQFSQNYVSSNWYAGGNSSFAMLTILKGMAKYDAKKWISWETTAEWRTGINTVSGDSLRKINMSDDLFKVYSNFGVKIIPDKLYGSVNAEFQTQFFNTWNPNTQRLKTGPFSPVRMNIGAGINYTPLKNLTLVFSPIAYKMVYVRDTARMNVKDFGVAAGEKALNTAGSSVRLNWKWQPLREVLLETQFYMYTNYRMVELDLEVNCDFIVNRYISARVSLHPRYDSSLIKDGDTRAKMQFKELISVGFSHKFY